MDKAEQLIASILRETYENRIKWQVEDAPRILTKSTENFYRSFYATRNPNSSGKIGIYDKSYKYYTDYDEFSWVDTLGICILDSEDRITWSYEANSPSLFRLFETAREQTSGIDDLLNSFNLNK